MKKLLIVILTIACLTGFAFAEGLVIGEKPVKLELDGKNGGRMDRSGWCSSELETTAWVLFYVDPDESDMNVAAEDTLDILDIPKTQLKSAAVINYRGTKLPGFAVTIILKNKQKKYPDTLYLTDKKHVFVETWGLTDNSYCTLVFDKTGVLVYRFDGPMDEEEIAKYIEVIQANL
ncbi:MAG: YtfJ family protein [Candidatus Marinimicrobia bacterium]|nr:YtfJ family protein [Candidatus Neomarinimicrobiota bacterium]